MEEASLRFPHLTEKILEKLDNQSLTKCRKISNDWKKIVRTQKDYWIRKITGHTNCSQATVKNVLRKSNRHTIFICT